MATHQITAAKWDSVLGANGIAKPGDTVELLPGEYTGRSFPIWRSGTPDAPIIIDAQPGAKFDGKYVFPADTGIGGRTSLKGVRAVYDGLVAVRSSHVTLRNFHVTRSQGRGISIYGKTDKRTTGITIEDSTIAYNRLNCVASQDASYIAVRGCTIHDGNNYIAGVGDGVSESGTWGAMCQAVDADHVVYENNDVYHGWGEGIIMQFGTEDCIVRRNRVGDTAASKIYADRAVRCTIEDNIVWDSLDETILKGENPSVGISCRNEVRRRTAPPLTDLTIARNLVVGCAYGVMVGGTQKEQLDPVTNVNVHHNTLADCQEAAIFLSGQLVHVGCVVSDNLLFQPNGKFYSNPEPHAGYTVGPNAYSGTIEQVPEKCRHAGDYYGVTFVPSLAASGEMVINPANYQPAESYGGMGAFAYNEPPPPPVPLDEVIVLKLGMRMAPGLAEELRKALIVHGVDVVIE